MGVILQLWLLVIISRTHVAAALLIPLPLRRWAPSGDRNGNFLAYNVAQAGLGLGSLFFGDIRRSTQPRPAVLGDLVLAG